MSCDGGDDGGDGDSSSSVLSLEPIERQRQQHQKALVSRPKSPNPTTDDNDDDNDDDDDGDDNNNNNNDNNKWARRLARCKKKAARDLLCQRQEMVFWFDGEMKLKNGRIGALERQLNACRDEHDGWRTEHAQQMDSVNDELSALRLASNSIEHTVHELLADAQQQSAQWPAFWRAATDRVHKVKSWTPPPCVVASDASMTMNSALLEARRARQHDATCADRARLQLVNRLDEHTVTIERLRADVARYREVATDATAAASAANAAAAVATAKQRRRTPTPTPSSRIPILHNNNKKKQQQQHANKNTDNDGGDDDVVPRREFDRMRRLYDSEVADRRRENAGHCATLERARAELANERTKTRDAEREAADARVKIERLQRAVEVAGERERALADQLEARESVNQRLLRVKIEQRRALEAMEEELFATVEQLKAQKRAFARLMGRVDRATAGVTGGNGGGGGGGDGDGGEVDDSTTGLIYNCN